MTESKHRNALLKSGCDIPNNDEFQYALFTHMYDVNTNTEIIFEHMNDKQYEIVSNIMKDVAKGIKLPKGLSNPHM